MKALEQFQADLLQSVREMKARKAARTTSICLPELVAARNKMGLTQSEFAVLLGVSLRTLQDWEQGRRMPSGAARTLLKIAVQHPEALRGLKVA
ncbi:MAG: helix-turn-helix domain-containing protein [Cystobacterineae bacterium]|nr:helix-turn-helix domain-containing protein [Cystobacterineae bacterium]